MLFFIFSPNNKKNNKKITLRLIQFGIEKMMEI